MNEKKLPLVSCSVVFFIALGSLMIFRTARFLRRTERQAKQQAARAEQFARVMNESMAGMKQVDMVRLINSLSHGDWMVRKSAAHWLGGTRDKKAVEPLIESLDDEHFGVRQSAAESLGRIGDERAVDALIAHLSDPAPEVRKAICWSLGALEETKAVKPVCGQLTDWNVGPNAAIALDRLGWKPASDAERIHYLVARRDVPQLSRDWQAAKPLLLKDLTCGDATAERNAAFALMGLGKEEVLNDLVGKLNRDGDAELARVFLVSGNAQLEAAAQRWLKSHDHSPPDESDKLPSVKWGGM